MNMTSIGLAAALACATALAGCQSTDSTTTETAETQDVSHNVGGVVTATGMFSGLSDHVVTGTASVFWVDERWVVSLGSDFELDGAPDPIVGLGNNGYIPEAKLGPLTAESGAQTYTLPAELDIGDYLQVYIWCEEFNVPLGVAELTLL